jgi:hypothetical protein
MANIGLQMDDTWDSHRSSFVFILSRDFENKSQLSYCHDKSSLVSGLDETRDHSSLRHVPFTLQNDEMRLVCSEKHVMTPCAFPK